MIKNILSVCILHEYFPHTPFIPNKNNLYFSAVLLFIFIVKIIITVVYYEEEVHISL